ncbi:MAG TPA: hypothetical protein PKC69_06050 [Chitinophagaceae bacterium]|nr:hypothetical protein [Chitinophagaceae bacterium]
MKKRYLALIGLLWMMGSAAQTVTDKSLGFFTGKWDFKIWTADNQSEKPDLSATWTLEKGLDSAACFIGQVQHEGHIFTREMIVYHPAAHVYKRMVATGNGDYFILKTSGWNGNRLTWTGTQYSPGKKHC